MELHGVEHLQYELLQGAVDEGSVPHVLKGFTFLEIATIVDPFLKNVPHNMRYYIRPKYLMPLP